MPKRKNVFYAYPGHPTSVAECIEGAIGALKSAPRIKQANLRFTPWTEMQIGGKTLISTITRNISRADIFACDLTHPNFNVTFELGYAIGKFKRVWLSLNEAVEASAQTYKRVYSGMLGGLNQSQSGIYIDNGLGSAANTVIPANAGVTKDFAPSGCAY